MQEIEKHSTKKYMFSLRLELKQKDFSSLFCQCFWTDWGKILSIFESWLIRTSVTSTKQLSLDRLKKPCIRYFFHFIFSTFVTHNMLNALTN